MTLSAIVNSGRWAETVAVTAVLAGFFAAVAPSLASSVRDARIDRLQATSVNPGDLDFDKAGQVRLRNVGATGTPVVVGRSSGDVLLKIPRRYGKPPCFAVARRAGSGPLTIASAACPKSSQRILDVSGFLSRRTADGWSTKILNLTGFTDGSISRIGIYAKGRFPRWYDVKARVYDVRFSTPIPADKLVALDNSGTAIWSQKVN